MGIERRLNNRVSQMLDINFLIMDKMTPNMLNAQDLLNFRAGLLVDFSSTGLSMKTWDIIDRWMPFLKSGDLTIGIQFQFAFEARPIYAITKVMWVKKIPPQKKEYLFGLKFTDISSTDLIKVRKYVIGNNKKSKK
ncbi:MAG: PilZ domain-containing protein [Candidatus Omnitrophica bacterium]|nr:PilZ domain-containing protein [Candidatus Omnitrophota bacterium]